MLTPKLFLFQQRGARDRINLEISRDKMLAWSVAALTRSKKLPDLTRFLEPPSTPRGEDALSAMRSFAKTLPKRSWEEWRKLSSGH